MIQKSYCTNMIIFLKERNKLLKVSTIYEESQIERSFTMNRFCTMLLFATVLIFLLLFSSLSVMADENVTEGTLQIINKDGKALSSCPLKHTDVKAEISGSIARVTVKQQFQNPVKEKIEAVYIFPLPNRAAVDNMVMKIGTRTIKGDIKKREEARKIYEDAKRQGHVASLLEQERPNIFTQSVANIMPGENIDIEISYVEYLNYQDGLYEFVFPMVVGPRYIPGKPSGQAQGTGWAEDTSKVPDASRITPQVTPKGTRAGHDISVKVTVDAGVPVSKVRSVLHKVTTVHQDGSSRAVVTLDQSDAIPNKDFILQYETAGNDMQDALLYHTKKGEGGFFSLILQPPLKPKASQITPKEMIFVIDTSGSQMGWPVEKAKETMKYCIENMNDGDTFNLMAFSNNVNKLFESSMPNTKENREKALDFLAHRLGSGGTEMLPAILAALTPAENPKLLRIVTFMTDGYVGNDMEIVNAVKKNIGNARLFSFGVGNSVNRYLLDKMAEMGRGEVEYVTLNRHGDEVAEAFQRKIGTPLLTDISIDWANLPVKDVYPKSHPDLFSGKPLIITGRYSGDGRGTVTLNGKVAGSPYSRKIEVSLPQNEPKHDVLASLWARTKIEDLMDQDLTGIQNGTPDPEIKKAITDLGLAFRLMTQYTSFVAVEEKIVTEGGVPKTIAVPVEMPDGVSYEGVFGETESSKDKSRSGSGYAGGPSSGKVMRSISLPTNAPSGAGSSIAAPSQSLKQQGYAAGEDDDTGYANPPKKPEEKLDPMLKNIAQRVKQEGKDGNLKVNGCEIKGGRISLIVTVTHMSEKVLDELKKAGLSVESYSAGSKVLKGTTAVENIETLLKLRCVDRIEPYLSGASSKVSLNSDAEIGQFISMLPEACAIYALSMEMTPGAPVLSLQFPGRLQ